MVGARIAREPRMVRRAGRLLNRPTSVFFFTHHKCASTFVPRMLRLAAGDQYTHVDYGASLWRYPNDVLDRHPSYEAFFESAHPMLFEPRGHIYGPHRAPFSFSGMFDYRAIFFLRDPRDVLVSWYYSTAFTHETPRDRVLKEQFAAGRSQALDASIDEFVLGWSRTYFKDVFDKYREMRELFRSSVFVSYDQFRRSPIDTASAIYAFLGVTPPAGPVSRLAGAAQPTRSAIRLEHKRSGRSGQFAHELRPETVEALNATFAGHLRYWGFESGHGESAAL
ncbi:MAG: sulfotransferase domain-containing protein [Caulobacterales bacterium]|nr:sulfotransferase domain-containing protein [Caulobacterales bacterium]